MSKRVLQGIGMAAMILAVTFVVNLIGSVSLRGQSAPAATRRTPKTTSPTLTLKTAWGEPDLQGIWADLYETPLERPAKYAGREFLTEAERAERDKEIAVRFVYPDRVAPKGTEQDVAGAYDKVYVSVKPASLRTSLIVDPPDGKMPPVQPAVTERMKELRAYQLALLQATNVCKNKLLGCEGGTYGPPSPRREEAPPSYLATGDLVASGGVINRADGPEDRSLGERCMGTVLPDFGGYRRIVQAPGVVSILYDIGQGQGRPRVIPVTTRPHLPPHVRLGWGDSRGHWEGNTLVVDVTNFTPKTDFHGSRENLHLIERFTRVDTNRIQYEVRIEDPTTWARPWTVKQEMTLQDNQANRIYAEPRCQEGNFGMVGLLAGARAEEKAFAEGRGPDPATKCSSGCGYDSKASEVR